MRCGVTGSPNARSIMLRRAAAGEVGADAGTAGKETECLCMTTAGTYDTRKDMSKKGQDKCDSRLQGEYKVTLEDWMLNRWRYEGDRKQGKGSQGDLEQGKK